MGFLFNWLRRLAPHPLLWLGAPIALYSWTLVGPFVSDDLTLLLKAERVMQGQGGPLDMYRFVTNDQKCREFRDRGSIPWWTPPSLRLDFFRPVSDLAFYLDVRLFGRNPLGYRIMSLGVLVAALLCVHRLFMKASGDVVRAGAATFFYGISQTVTPPATWMCNRQDLLVVIGVTLAAAAYWEASRQPRVKLMAIFIAAFALALLSKEVAIALAGIICIHEMVLRVRGDVRPGRGMCAGIAIVVLLMSVGYLGYYVYSRPWAFGLAGGDGTQNQLGSQLPRSLLLYASVWTIGFPVDVLGEATPAQVIMVAAAGGLFMLLTIFFLRKSLRCDPTALFFVLWATLFIVPGLRSLTPSTRTLCTATVGWCWLLSDLLVPRDTGYSPPLLYRLWMLSVNTTVSICCVIGTVLFMNSTETTACNRLRKAVATQPSPLQDGDTLFLDQAHSAFEIMCAGDRLEFLTGRRGICAVYLLAPGINASLTPINEHAIEARSSGDNLFGSLIHRLALGPNWRAKPGLKFELTAFTAEITEVDSAGRVRGLRFDFHKPLTSPRFHFDPPSLAHR